MCICTVSIGVMYAVVVNVQSICICITLFLNTATLVNYSSVTFSGVCDYKCCIIYLPAIHIKLIDTYSSYVPTQNTLTSQCIPIVCHSVILYLLGNHPKV